MKIYILLLLSFSLAFCYVVDNSSIKVGITNPNGFDGATIETNALKSTLTNLGFGYYQSPTSNGSDYESHGCQIVYNGKYTYPVTGWDWRMSLQGRGYIEQGGPPYACWPYFAYGEWTGSDTPTSAGHVFRAGNCELLNFPNLMPSNWMCHLYNAGYDPISHHLMTGEDPPFNQHAKVQHPLLQLGFEKNGLLSRQTGKGRGLFCGWQIYGPDASSYDKNLFENLIIYAAQPPKAEAGEIYSAPVGVPVTLDASDSTDDQMIVLYQWDIDNDGIYEISTPNPIAQWTWQQPYNGDIELRVKDNLNCQSCDWAYGQIGFVDVNPDTVGTIKSLFHQ